jgi:hypothetical protein
VALAIPWRWRSRGAGDPVALPIALASLPGFAYPRAMEGTHFVVRRDRLSEHEIVVAPRGPLAEGDAELRVDTFGFTANNINYALRGDAMSYWKFFPEARAGWGRVPAWGFGTVVRTASDVVAVGERFYGYYPMSSHLVVHPKRIDDAGFFDSVAHRRDLSAVYNHYARTTRDPSYRPDTESLQCVLRPVFGTSYFLADYLREYGFFDGEVALVSSASSKLAWGMAFALAGASSDGRRVRPKIIGLTSERHQPFVTRLGLFDGVLTYAEVATLPATRRAVYVDIAGSQALRSAIHEHFGSALRYSLMVGATHQEPQSPVDGLPGPEPIPFFVPAWIRHRNHQWSADTVRRQLGEAWQKFVASVLDPTRGWMTIAPSAGSEAVARTYQDVLAGRADPDQGHVLSLSNAA